MQTQPERIDILLLTAVDDEYEMLKKHVRPDGRVPGWQPASDQRMRPLLYGQFCRPDQADLRVIASKCGGMGEDRAYQRGLELAVQFEPRCLAMSGVCAGNPAKTTAGDLIVCTESWRFGPGKVMAEYVNESVTTKKENDIQIMPLSSESMTEKAMEFFPMFRNKFASELGALFPDPNWNIEKYNCLRCAIQCVRDVTLDERIFENARNFKRDTNALEMESFAIARIALQQQIEHVILAKGVQDHARSDIGSIGKSDKYRAFAAASSALFILEFLRSMPFMNPKRAAEKKEIFHDRYNKCRIGIIDPTHSVRKLSDPLMVSSLGAGCSPFIVRVSDVNNVLIEEFVAFANPTKTVFLPVPEGALRHVVSHRAEICKNASSIASKESYQSFLSSAKIKVI